MNSTKHNISAATSNTAAVQPPASTTGRVQIGVQIGANTGIAAISSF